VMTHHISQATTWSLTVDITQTKAPHLDKTYLSSPGPFSSFCVWFAYDQLKWGFPWRFFQVP
jgi:hypothetical protein